MILSDIKRYLKTHQQARLTDMALHFDTPPDAIRGMLEIWIRKGKVARTQINQACGSSCNKCDEANIEIYRWQDER
jgi:predicted ArsR family transcriptional regulator